MLEVLAQQQYHLPQMLGSLALGHHLVYVVQEKIHLVHRIGKVQ
jgi:hypothetical protein